MHSKSVGRAQERSIAAVFTSQRWILALFKKNPSFSIFKAASCWADFVFALVSSSIELRSTRTCSISTAMLGWDSGIPVTDGMEVY